MSLRPIATACVLAGLALLLFLLGLGLPRLTPDELAFNAQSHVVSQTPVFFHVAEDRWLQPMAVYANAAVRAVGGNDQSGRLASAIVAAIGVGLAFLLAFEITGRLWLGLLAAVILALTPAYRSFAQLGTDAIFPVPLMLLWMLNLLHFFKRDSLASLSIAAASLGLAAYASPAAPLTAIFLWILTLAVARQRNRARLLTSTIVFGAAWLPAVYWFARHFDTYGDTFGRWVVFAPHLRNPMDGFRAFINPGTLGDRSSRYWNFWDPSWLFFDAKDAVAPLLMLAAPFIAFGVYRATKRLPRDAAAILIGTALIAPLAGSTFGIAHFMSDAAVVLPILAVFTAIGVDQLVAWVVRREALENDVVVGAVEGVYVDDALPRS